MVKSQKKTKSEQRKTDKKNKTGMEKRCEIRGCSSP